MSLQANLSLLSSGSVDEQELTDTEWFFLASKMLSFVNGSDLPGKAFTSSNPVWVPRVSSLASHMTGLVRASILGSRPWCAYTSKLALWNWALLNFFYREKKLDNPEAELRALTSRLDSTQSCNSKLENLNEEHDDTVPTVKSKTVSSVQIVKPRYCLK